MAINLRQLFKICYKDHYTQHDKKPICRCGWPTVPPISEGQRQTSGCENKTISHSDYIPINAMVTLLDLYPTLEYYTVIRRTWVMAAGKNVAFKIAAKLLETWLLLVAYRTSSTYSTADPLYDVQFSHDTCALQTDRRQTRRHIVRSAN